MYEQLLDDLAGLTGAVGAGLVELRGATTRVKVDKEPTREEGPCTSDSAD